MNWHAAASIWVCFGVAVVAVCLLVPWMEWIQRKTDSLALFVAGTVLPIVVLASLYVGAFQ